ncbi:Uncharacterized protein APZ42_018533 [Daphnia magna]|uniref:Uncharacterized protein n=1 Tax=Daphnia magna TaxID=35525 RepID=A0A164Z1I1_9CRUS|nr:Uncharacterized protein APZ42_018533 [Daphnia magna]
MRTIAVGSCSPPEPLKSSLRISKVWKRLSVMKPMENVYRQIRLVQTWVIIDAGLVVRTNRDRNMQIELCKAIEVLFDGSPSSLFH